MGKQAEKYKERKRLNNCTLFLCKHWIERHNRRKELFGNGTFSLKVEKDFVNLLYKGHFVGLWRRGCWDDYDTVISVAMNMRDAMIWEAKR